MSPALLVQGGYGPQIIDYEGGTSWKNKEEMKTLSSGEQTFTPSSGTGPYNSKRHKEGDKTERSTVLTAFWPPSAQTTVFSMEAGG